MKIQNHPRRTTTKLMVVGDSGAGKTSLLAGLANAGYKVRMFDFDHAADAVIPFLTEDGMGNFSYIDCSEDNDKETAVGLFKKMAHEGWVSDDENFGPVSSWNDDKIVVVIDSLTAFSEAAKRVALKKAGKKRDDQLSQADWGEAQRIVMGELSWFMSRAVSCNVVVNAHMATVEDEATGATRFYPACCGKSLSLIVARYFNNVFRLDPKVVQGVTKRTLRTVSDNKMALKNTAPTKLKPDEEPDLARIFAILQGRE